MSRPTSPRPEPATRTRRGWPGHPRALRRAEQPRPACCDRILPKPPAPPPRRGCRRPPQGRLTPGTLSAVALRPGEAPRVAGPVAAVVCFQDRSIEEVGDELLLGGCFPRRAVRVLSLIH